MREEIQKNPFGQIKKAFHQPKERGVLCTEEAVRVIQLEEEDPLHTLAVQLALFCGMRCGEVRGLLWGDIDFSKGIINIVHNYVHMDGMKSPKAGSARRVPLTDSVRKMLDAVHAVSMWVDADDFVFCQADKRKTARGQHFFRYSVEVVLRKIGIEVEEQRRRNLVFHSLRHTFVTLGRLSGLTDMEIMNLAGHKTSAMMERYSHAGQVIDFVEAKKRLESIALSVQQGSQALR